MKYELTTTMFVRNIKWINNLLRDLPELKIYIRDYDEIIQQANYIQGVISKSLGDFYELLQTTSIARRAQ